MADDKDKPNLPTPDRDAKVNPAPALAGGYMLGQGRDEAAEQNAQRLAELQPKPYSADQIATPPTDAPFVGGKQVQVLVGPYIGSVLTMPEAEADAAVNDHWAIELRLPPFDENEEREHPPLTDEERTHASEAAQAWADKVNKPPETEPPPEPPEGGEGRRREQEAEAEREREAQRQRDMQPDQGRGYQTKAEPAKRR